MTDESRQPNIKPEGGVDPFVCPRGHHSVALRANRFTCRTCENQGREQISWDRSELVDLREEEPPLRNEGNVATDGGFESGETSQVTLGGDVRKTEEPDTSEDYKFSRPQCQAKTSDGDRCSNPVRRTDGDPDFCPRHYDSDDVERHGDAESSGGESDGE